MSHVLHVVGARPNFMKAAPVHAALERRGAHQSLVHTGQHFSEAMSQVFFDDLGLPVPSANLGVGPGTHAYQTAHVMLGLEPLVSHQKPDWVVVYGDVNSTAAAALVCAKLRVPAAHVEAGLRSRDREMPEEHNRIVTDHLVDLLLTPSADADANLRAEGIPRERIRCVGNVMIDTLMRFLPRARELAPLGLRAGADFVLVTLHRPANVDSLPQLTGLVAALEDIARDVCVVFPVHPRTRAALREQHLRHVRLCEPLGYLDFLALQSRAALVITDSGGVQEETTFLGVPCLTVRKNTERPVTVELGTNELVGTEPAHLVKRAREILGGDRKGGTIPPLWDGKAADRVAAALHGE